MRIWACCCSWPAASGLTALVVDTLACALDLPGATLLPLSGLFLVPWVIGHGSAPAWTFLVVALSWVGILATAQGDWARRWAPAARAGRVALGMAVTAAVALAALFGGAVAGSRGPDPHARLRPRPRPRRGHSAGRRAGQPAPLPGRQRRPRGAHLHHRRRSGRLPAPGRPRPVRRRDVEPRAARLSSTGTPPTWAAGFGPQTRPGAYDVHVGPLGGATLPSPEWHRRRAHELAGGLGPALDPAQPLGRARASAARQLAADRVAGALGRQHAAPGQRAGRPGIRGLPIRPGRPHRRSSVPSSGSSPPRSPRVRRRRTTRPSRCRTGSPSPGASATPPRSPAARTATRWSRSCASASATASSSRRRWR